MGVLISQEIPAGFFYRGTFVPCKAGRDASADEVGLDSNEFTGASTLTLETRSLFLPAALLSTERAPLDFRNALMADEAATGFRGAYFEAQGNAVWGSRRGFTLRIEGAAINRAHLVPYLWRKLLFGHGILFLFGTLPHTSPYRSLFPVLTTESMLWISWPKAVPSRSVHFFARGKQE